VGTFGKDLNSKKQLTGARGNDHKPSDDPLDRADDGRLPEEDGVPKDPRQHAGSRGNVGLQREGAARGTTRLRNLIL
jgi:hypothetical protein